MGYGKLGARGGFGSSGFLGGARGSNIAAFRASALKISSINATPRTLASSALSIDISNTGNSTINGRTFAQGGIVVTPTVPDGYSGPLNANSSWIITKDPSVATSANLTYAPGNSKLFLFTGQKFDFKCLVGSSFSIRWSADSGLTWKYSDQVVPTQSCWCLIDFGAPLGSGGVAEVIGESEIFETFGFNFDNGMTTPAAFVDSALPKGMMFGDSYVFCQGTRLDGIANDQHATLGMCRQAGQALGSLQIYNNGFRTNGFSNTHSIQSRFCDRIKDPLNDSLSEGSVWGTLDYVIIPGSINDASNAFDSTRLADATLAFQNLRAKQPSALIVFPIGANPPEDSEPANWINDYKNAFKAVFGSTTAAQTTNGAILLDGTRATGAAWVPAGVSGSSIYINPTGDPTYSGHPSPAGHAFFGQQYAAAAVTLANAIIAATGGSGGSTFVPTFELLGF